MTNDQHSQTVKTATMAFSSKTALVTGAGGDIGRATAVRLAAGGAQLLLTDIAVAEPGLSKTVAACSEVSDVESMVVHCDVTDESAVIAMFAHFDQSDVPPDLLFNNAGYQGHFTSIADYDVADFRRVLDINVTGVMLVLRSFARSRISVGEPGVAVNMASMAHGGAPNMAAYSASKAAVVALTKSAAKDLAAHHIRVNSVSPAFIGPGAMWDRQVELQAATPSQYFSDDPAEVAEQMLSSVPMRRYGSLDEVAKVVQFLLSDESSYVTAFNLEVSGGGV